MTEEETREIAEKIISISTTERGTIISEAILLEKVIDAFIVCFFTDDEKKQKQMFLLIMGNEKISLNNKIQILQTIIEQNFPEVKNKYPKLFKDLQNLITERNMYAHHIIDSSSDSISNFKNKNQIGFRKFRNEIKINWRNINNSEDFVKKSIKCMRIINNISLNFDVVKPKQNEQRRRKEKS